MIKLFTILTLATLFYRSTVVEPVEVPILMYHHISEEATNSLVVTPEKFERDMVTLKENGYVTIHLNQLHDYLSGRGSLPPKPIVITFDDGYTSNYTYAFETAKKTGSKLTFAPIGGAISKEKAPSGTNITPHYTMAQMREMSASGLIDFQYHTFDLHNPDGYSLWFSSRVGTGVKSYTGESPKRYCKRLTVDWLRYTTTFRLGGIKRPEYVIYPYGIYTNESEQVFKSLVKGTITTINGIRIYKTVDEMRLMPRLNITEQTNVIEIINNN